MRHASITQSKLLAGRRSRAPNVVNVLQQRGFLSPSVIAVLIVLLAMLLVPLWLGNKSMKARNLAAQAEKAQSEGAVHVSPTTPAAAPKLEVVANAHGLSWGFMSKTGLPEGVVWPACHGEPKPGFDLPHNNSCNPYKGDTSCRIVMPVLCFKKDGSSASSVAGLVAGNQITPNGAVTDAWAGGEVASTEPVAGFVLESLAAANARCEKELGAGWRMAEFHDGNDGQGGWGFVAKKGGRLYTGQRHWVHINNQKGNCWDPAT